MAQPEYQAVSGYTGSPQYSDAPEVVGGGFNGVNGSVNDAAYSAPEHIVYDHSDKIHVQSNVDTAKTGDNTGNRPLWNRKKFWIIAAVLLLAIIALVVGLVVGLVVNKDSSGDDAQDGQSGQTSDDDKSSDDKPIDPASICSGSLCPQVLSATGFEQKLHVFARTSNNTLEYNVGDGVTFNKEWEDLGETVGKLISQPASMAWEVDGKPRLDVYALSSSENSVQGRHRQDGAWSDWEDFGSGGGSQPIICKVADDRIDLWITDVADRNIMHRFWVPESDEYSAQDEEQQFQPAAGLEDTGPTASAPGAVCRDDKFYHDLVWYDREDNSLWHRVYSNDDGFSVPYHFDGDFIGDPVLVTFDDNPIRIDFYGVQENREVYHFRKENDEYSGLETLGGNVTSVPSVISPSEGVYDVVALGADGLLKHIHYDGSAWAKNWEDLGVAAISAPLAVLYDSKIVLFALGSDGVQLASWESGGEDSWADLVDMKPLNGDPSLEFFVADS